MSTIVMTAGEYLAHLSFFSQLDSGYRLCWRSSDCCARRWWGSSATTWLRVETWTPYDTRSREQCPPRCSCCLASTWWPGCETYPFRESSVVAGYAIVYTFWLCWLWAYVAVVVTEVVPYHIFLDEETGEGTDAATDAVLVLWFVITGLFFLALVSSTAEVIPRTSYRSTQRSPGCCARRRVPSPVLAAPMDDSASSHGGDYSGYTSHVLITSSRGLSQHLPDGETNSCFTQPMG